MVLTPPQRACTQWCTHEFLYTLPPDAWGRFRRCKKTRSTLEKKGTRLKTPAFTQCIYMLSVYTDIFIYIHRIWRELIYNKNLARAHLGERFVCKLKTPAHNIYLCLVCIHTYSYYWYTLQYSYHILIDCIYIHIRIKYTYIF